MPVTYSTTYSRYRDREIVTSMPVTYSTTYSRYTDKEIVTLHVVQLCYSVKEDKPLPWRIVTTEVAEKAHTE